MVKTAPVPKGAVVVTVQNHVVTTANAANVVTIVGALGLVGVVKETRKEIVVAPRRSKRLKNPGAAQRKRSKRLKNLDAAPRKRSKRPKNLDAAPRKRSKRLKHLDAVPRKNNPKNAAAQAKNQRTNALVLVDQTAHILPVAVAVNARVLVKTVIVANVVTTAVVNGSAGVAKETRREIAVVPRTS